jgi:hypothetical protein
MNNHIPANPLTMAPAGRAAVAHRFPQLNMWLPRGNLGGRSCEQALEVGDVVAGEVLPFLDQIIDSCGEHPPSLCTIWLPFDLFEQLPLCGFRSG